jgi:hypothetical protein
MQSWRELEGTELDGLRLERLIKTEPAVFSARYLQPSPDRGGEVFVRFLRERPGDEQVVARCLEASYLSHPNLARCYGTGSYSTPANRYVYVITEPAETTLSQLLQERPLTVDETRELGMQLAAGLTYLHERNLVCCSLDPSTITKSNERWKIADYTQLRVSGDSNATETRRLLASSPAVPPEAFEGVVSPAWDAWSLATVLMAALSGPKPERGDAPVRPVPKRDLSEPFAKVVSECLAADPHQRCTVERIAEMLRDQPIAAVPESTPPEPLETRFRVHAPGKRRWPLVVAGIAAVAAGAFIAAITLHSEHAPTPRAAAVAVDKPVPGEPVPGTETADRDRAAPLPGGDRPQIYALLNRWISASRLRNVDAQADCYAPEVDVFYGARHVSQDWVRRNRAKTLDQAGKIRQLDIQNVQIRLDSTDRASVWFDKTWDFGGGYSGKVRQQLELRKLEPGWRITGERDLRVYKVRSGRGGRGSV